MDTVIYSVRLQDALLFLAFIGLYAYGSLKFVSLLEDDINIFKVLFRDRMKIKHIFAPLLIPVAIVGYPILLLIIGMEKIENMISTTRREN